MFLRWVNKFNRICTMEPDALGCVLAWGSSGLYVYGSLGASVAGSTIKISGHKDCRRARRLVVGVRFPLGQSGWYSRRVNGRVVRKLFASRSFGRMFSLSFAQKTASHRVAA